MTRSKQRQYLLRRSRVPSSRSKARRGVSSDPSAGYDRKRPCPLCCTVSVPHNNGLVFATQARARFVAQLHNALEKARTWGEFRSLIPRAEYSCVIRGSFDDLDERRPRSHDSFSAEQVAGWSDGDLPPWLQQGMGDLRPSTRSARFGEKRTRPSMGVSGSFRPKTRNR